MAEKENKLLVLRDFKQPSVPGKYYRLMCMTGEMKGTSYYISKQLRVVMGRGDKCEIKVMDSKCSREHAEITRIGTEYVITDLGSQNGIIINDLNVNQHKLENNDKIIIGQTVFKYTVVDVADQDAAKKLTDSQNENEKEGEKPKENRKMVMILSGILVTGVLFLFDGGDDQKNDNVIRKKAQDVSDSFTQVMQKKKQDDDKEVKGKVDEIIHRGLREYREGNYFRAIAEFNLALVLNPGNKNATFYLQKTTDQLDKEIEKNFIKGTQDVESYKIESAIKSYCSIVRLLDYYKDDKRYIEAKENINHLEEKIGREKDETDCLKEK